jgi:hypothetical protein
VQADALVLGANSGTSTLIDSEDPAVVGALSLAPGMRNLVAAATSSDHRTLFIVAKFVDNSWKLARISLTRREVEWTLDVAVNGGAVIPEFAGVRLFGVDGIAVSSDGANLLLTGARQNGNWGAAVVNAATPAVTRFLSAGPLFGPPVTMRGEGLAGADTVIAIAGVGPDENRPSDSALVLRMGATPAIVGRIPAPPGSSRIGNLARGPAGQVYVAGNASIGVYDLRAAAYGPVRQMTVYGNAISSTDGQLVALTDPGSATTNPRGFIPLFDRNLSPVYQVDLRSLGQGGVPPVVSHLAFGVQGARLLLGAGTTELRPDARPPELGRVLIVQPPYTAVTKVLPLTDYGPPYLVPLP